MVKTNKKIRKTRGTEILRTGVYAISDAWSDIGAFISLLLFSQLLLWEIQLPLYKLLF
jgi:hypothetical protein